MTMGNLLSQATLLPRTWKTVQYGLGLQLRPLPNQSQPFQYSLTLIQMWRIYANAWPI
jgi:hypothetical protein